MKQFLNNIANRLKSVVMKKKRRPTRRMLLKILAFQAALLSFTLMIVTFWPERALASGGLVILSWGITVILWLEALEYRLGDVDPKDNELETEETSRSE
jgi:sterol desaturase/sphingolipid hydroxylase (fatty acid hydroxylase superfamily)